MCLQFLNQAWIILRVALGHALGSTTASRQTSGQTSVQTPMSWRVTSRNPPPDDDEAVIHTQKEWPLGDRDTIEMVRLPLAGSFGAAVSMPR
jgi:hypothetical protein